MAVPVDQRTGPFFRQWRFESRLHGGGQGPTLVAFDETGHRALAVRSGDGPIRTRAISAWARRWTRRLPFACTARCSKSPCTGGLPYSTDSTATRRRSCLWTGALYDPGWTLAQSRSEIGVAGLMTNDFVFYQVGSVLRCADAVTGNLVWERRNVPSSYCFRETRNTWSRWPAASRTIPPAWCCARPPVTEVLSGLFGVAGPLSNEWKGRRVLMTTSGPSHLSLSLLDLVQRGKARLEPQLPDAGLATTPIDDEEFAVLDSRGVLHIHSFETGRRSSKRTIERPGSPSQVLVRRVGRRYLVISQGGAVRFPGFRDIPRGLPSGKIWAIDRDSGKTAWTASMPVPQDPRRNAGRFAGPRVPAAAGSLRIGPIQRRGSLCRSSMRGPAHCLYDTAETTPPERINVRLDRDARRVIVTTDKCVLTIAPSETFRSTSPAPPNSTVRPARASPPSGPKP